MWSKFSFYKHNISKYILKRCFRFAYGNILEPKLKLRHNVLLMILLQKVNQKEAHLLKI